MAFGIDTKKIEDNKGGDFEKETKFIEAGLNPARLVSYVELGWHDPMYQGKPKVYADSHKKAGQPKPPEFMIQLVFEFPLADHNTDFPQTIKTSIPFKDGTEFLNGLPVTRALYDGTLSMKYANMSNYKKYLDAMNDSLGTTHASLSNFIGEAFLIAVTNKTTDKHHENGDAVVYSNMKPDGIQSTVFKNPMTRKEEVVEVPDQVGEYCRMFSWDAPTPESWNALPEYLQKCMLGAADFTSSPLAVMLSDMPVDDADDAEGTPPDNTGTPAVAEDDIPA